MVLTMVEDARVGLSTLSGAFHRCARSRSSFPIAQHNCSSIQRRRFHHGIEVVSLYLLVGLEYVAFHLSCCGEDTLAVDGQL